MKDLGALGWLRTGETDVTSSDAHTSAALSKTRRTVPLAEETEENARKKHQKTRRIFDQRKSGEFNGKKKKTEKSKRIIQRTFVCCTIREADAERRKRN